MHILQTIKDTASDKKKDPWTDPENLARIVKIGLFDAPQLCGNPHAAGKVFTQIKNGACDAFDPHSGKYISEKERVSRILKEAGQALP